MQQWAGAAIGLSGLALLLWPDGATAPDPLGALLMAVAGIGWGLYSLAGRGPRNCLDETAANFILAAPLTIAPLMLVGSAFDAGSHGILLAVLSGAVTSGLGYALWYRALPHLQASSAAVAQLNVPLIATAGGIALLGEEPSARFAVASLLVLGASACPSPRRGSAIDPLLQPASSILQRIPAVRFGMRAAFVPARFSTSKKATDTHEVRLNL